MAAATVGCWTKTMAQWATTTMRQATPRSAWANQTRRSPASAAGLAPQGGVYTLSLMATPPLEVGAASAHRPLLLRIGRTIDFSEEEICFACAGRDAGLMRSCQAACRHVDSV